MGDRKRSSDTREHRHLTQRKHPSERTSFPAGARWRRVIVIATRMVVITMMVINCSNYIDDNDADGGGR